MVTELIEPESMHLHCLSSRRVATGTVRDVGVHHFSEKVLPAYIFRVMTVIAGVGLEIARSSMTGDASDGAQPSMI